MFIPSICKMKTMMNKTIIKMVVVANRHNSELKLNIYTENQSSVSYVVTEFLLIHDIFSHEWNKFSQCQHDNQHQLMHVFCSDIVNFLNQL